MATEPVSFETDVKPLFRERDRESMEFAFDLWSADDVSENADAILDRLKAGTMPCDGGLASGTGRPLRALGRRRQSALILFPEGIRMVSTQSRRKDHGLHLEGVSRAA